MVTTRAGASGGRICDGRRATLAWLAQFLMSVGLLLAAPGAASGSPLTPKELPGAKVITAQQAHALIKQGVPIYDVRVGHEYAEEHIKGAISLPYKERSAKDENFDSTQDQFDLSKLPREKSWPVIFYCNAGECWKSYKASKVAVRTGHTAVHWLRGGIPEWKQEKLPVN